MAGMTTAACVCMRRGGSRRRLSVQASTPLYPLHLSSPASSALSASTSHLNILLLVEWPLLSARRRRSRQPHLGGVLALEPSYPQAQVGLEPLFGGGECGGWRGGGDSNATRWRSHYKQHNVATTPRATRDRSHLVRVLFSLLLLRGVAIVTRRVVVHRAVPVVGDGCEPGDRSPVATTAPPLTHPARTISWEACLRPQHHGAAATWYTCRTAPRSGSCQSPRPRP